MMHMKIDVWKVKLIMAQKGYSRQDVAAWADTTTQNIGNILRKGIATPKAAGKLAKGLGVPVTEIVVEDGT